MTGMKVKLSCRSCSWTGDAGFCRVHDLVMLCPHCGDMVYDKETSKAVFCPYCKWIGVLCETEVNIDGHDHDGCPKCGTVIKEASKQ